VLIDYRKPGNDAGFFVCSISFSDAYESPPIINLIFVCSKKVLVFLVLNRIHHNVQKGFLLKVKNKYLG